MGDPCIHIWYVGDGGREGGREGGRAGWKDGGMDEGMETEGGGLRVKEWREREKLRRKKGGREGRRGGKVWESQGRLETPLTYGDYY